MKKRKIRRKKLPGVTTAIALATRLGLREPKGLDNIPPAAMTTDCAENENEEEVLKQALKGMKPLTAKQARQLSPSDGDLDLRPGEYRSASGAVVYPDSEVITPYIGSEQEEREAQLTKGPLKPSASKEGEWPRSGCATCFGNGRLSFGVGKICPACEGKGWT